MPGYSLAIIQSPDGLTMEFPAALSLPFRSGAYTSGLFKTAQNFVAELLTQRGSVRFDPTYGSRLPNEMRGLNVTALSSVQTVLAGAINDVITNMRRRERPTDLADEWIAAVHIADIQQEVDRALVRLELMTEAGSKTHIQLPLEFLTGYA